MEVQIDGWPLGVTDEQKASFTELARKMLTELPKPVESWILLSHFKARQEKEVALTGFVWSPMWDWQYALLDRACRAAGASLCYVLEENGGRR